MIEQEGDLTHAGHGIIVQGCNAQGVMGSGVAKAIRERWPQVFDVYRKTYEDKGLRLGQTVWVKVQDSPVLMIANSITQQFYGRDQTVRYVDYEAVRTCFREVGAAARKHDMAVHYPKIGAGLGNGEWGVIERIIKEELDGVEYHLWVPPTIGRARGVKI
jgi:O-acetyl-ADP-ribose deacetylase (regulator of RNase III)